VQDIGVKEKRHMRKATKYTDEPLGEIKVINDFLPPPSELVFKEDTVKVTLGLSRRSVDFFKKQAKKHDTQYQKMIRRLLDLYVTRQQR
jgi:predicted DNA binding CopG/RHH family protein